MYKLLLILFIAAIAFGERNPLPLLYAENRLDEAAAICRQYEVLAGKDRRVEELCAWIYLRTDRVESALKLMARLRESGGSRQEVQLLEAFLLAKQKKFEDAQTILDEFTKKYKGTRPGYDGEELGAEIKEMQGRLDTAAFIYKMLLNSDRNRPRAHNGLGKYYAARGDYKNAKYHYEIVSRAWPKFFGSRFELGVLALAKNQLPDASHWLAESYKLDKANPALLEQLGNYYEKKRQMGMATRFWKKALALKADSDIAKKKLTEYSGSSSEQVVEKLAAAPVSERQMRDLDSSLEKVPGSAKLLKKRATIYMKKGDFEKAAADWIVYLKSNNEDAEGFRELGACFVNMKQLDQAGEQFSKAIALEPANGLNYGWVAFVFESVGKLDEAREAWFKARNNFKQPKDVAKANRRIASIDKKLRDKALKQRKRQKEEQEEEE